MEMWPLSFIALFLIGTPFCRSLQPEDAPLRMEDVDEEARWNVTRARRYTYPQGFQYMYVGSDGRIVENHKPSTGHWIEVMGSPRASHQALYEVCRVVGKMLRHSPAHIFSNIANHPGAGVGIFSMDEKITVFPENYNLADTAACHGRCGGSCSHTCTFDGRKYEDIMGVTNSRSFVVEDNVLCTARDTYHHHNNILVHEFGHLVMRFGMTSAERAQVDQYWNHAKAQHLWNSDSYAMQTHGEYFAEGTGTWFRVKTGHNLYGGKNCPGQPCQDETEARNFLRSHDPQLYNLLSHIYNNGHPATLSGITVCPH